MPAINYCLAPSGNYVGWIVVDNGHYFGSGRTIDAMLKNVKYTLYFHKRMSVKGLYLNDKPTLLPEVPVQFMTKAFKTRAWFNHHNGPVTETKFVHISNESTKPVESEETYDFYEYKKVNGVLEVYGCKKIKEYQLQKQLNSTTDSILL